MPRTRTALALLAATIGLLGATALPASADQNSGYSTPTPTTAGYFDPHDQDVHGDLPKPLAFGEFGYGTPTPAGLGDWGHGSTPDPVQLELASTPCPAGKLCTYTETFWWGSMYYYSVPQVPQPLCTPIGAPYNNNIGSARNYTSHAVKFHDNGTCGNGSGYTTTYVLNPGASADWGFTIWDNRWSSIQWL